MRTTKITYHLIIIAKYLQGRSTIMKSIAPCQDDYYYFFTIKGDDGNNILLRRFLVRETHV